MSDTNPYAKRQLKKAKRLEAKSKKKLLSAEKREKRTSKSIEYFADHPNIKWKGVKPLFGTGKWARKRSEKLAAKAKIALAKAKAGSKKEYKKLKNE